MTITRRKFTTGLATAAAGLCAPGIARATPTGTVGRDRLWVINVHNGETINEPFVFRDPMSHRQAWINYSWFWRDTRDSDQAVFIDRRMLGILADVQVAISGHKGEEVPIHMVSGYRTPDRNATIPGAARNSQHCYGRACDFKLKQVRANIVAHVASRMQFVGGLGAYTEFTHIDTGPVGRRW